MEIYNVTDDSGNYYGTFHHFYDAIRAAWDMYCKYYRDNNCEGAPPLEEVWNELDNNWSIDGAVHIEEYIVARDYYPEYPIPIEY